MYAIRHIPSKTLLRIEVNNTHGYDSPPVCPGAKLGLFPDALYFVASLDDCQELLSEKYGESLYVSTIGDIAIDKSDGFKDYTYRKEDLEIIPLGAI